MDPLKVFLGPKCVGFDGPCKRRARAEHPSGSSRNLHYRLEGNKFHSPRAYVDGPLCEQCLVRTAGRQEEWNAQLKAPECPCCSREMRRGTSPAWSYLPSKYGDTPFYSCYNCGVDGDKLPGQLEKAEAALKEATEEYDANTKRALDVIATIKSRLKKGRAK